MKEQQGPKKLTDTEDESATDPKAQKHQDTEAQQSLDQKCSKNLQKMKAKCLRVCSLYIVVCVFQYFKWSIAVPFLCVLLCKSISCLCSLGTQHTKEQDPREWKEKGLLQDRDNQASHELPILTSSFEEVQVSLKPVREELFEQEHCCSVVQQDRQEQCQNGLAGPDQQNDPKQSQAHDQHSQKQEEEPSAKASDIIKKLYIGELQAPFHKGFKETQSLEFHSQWMKNVTDYQHFEALRLCAVLGSNDLQGPRSGKEQNRRNKKNIKKCKNRNIRDCSFNVQMHKVPRKKSGKCCRQMCQSTSQCLEHRGSGDSEIHGKQIHKEVQLRDDLEISDFKLLQEQDNVVPKNRVEQSPKQTQDTENNFRRADSTKGPGSQVKQSLQGRTGPQHRVMVGPLQLHALGPDVLRNPVKQSFIKPQLEESAYKHQHDAQEHDNKKTERLTWKGQYKQNVKKTGRLKELLSLENSRPSLNNQKRKRQAIWVGSRQGQACPFEIQCAELICNRGKRKRSMRIVIDLLPTESLPLPDINRRAAWWCPKDEQDVEWRDRMEGEALEEKCLIETLGEKQPCPRELPHSEREGSNTIQTSVPHHPMEQHGTDLVYHQRQQDPNKNTHAIASETPKNVLSQEGHCLQDLIKSEEQDSEQLQYIHSYERKLKRRVFLFKNRHRLKHSFEMHYANLIRKSGKSKKSLMIVNDLLAIEGLSLLNIKRWREWWCPKDKQGLEHYNQMEGNVFKEQQIIETFGTEKHGPRQHPHLESQGYNNPERPEEQQQVEKKETKLELLQKHHDPEQKVCKDPHVMVSEGPRNLLGLEELKSKVLVNSEEQESEQLQCTHSCDQMLENRHRFKGPFEMHYAELICETSKSEKPIQIVDGVLAKQRQPLLHMHKWGAWWCPRDDRGSEQQVYVVGKVCEEQGIPETLGTKEHYLSEKPRREQQVFNKQQKPQQQCPVEHIETELECPQKYQDEEQKLCKDLRVIPFIEMFGTDQHCARVPSHLEGQWSNKLERPEQQHPGEQKENKLEFPQKQQKPEQKHHKDLSFSEILGTEKHCPRKSSLLDWQYSNKLQIPEWQHLVEQKETEFDFPQKHRDPELRVEKDSQPIASDSPECFLDIEEEESEQLQCITTCSQMHKRQHIPRVPSHLGCQYSNKQHMPKEWYPREQKGTELEYPQKYNDPEERVQNVSNAIALDDPKNLLSLEEPSSEHLINSKEQRSGQLQYIPTCDQMLKRGSFWVENRDRFNEPFEMHYPELISKRGKTKNPIKVVNAVLANKGQPLLHIHKWGVWWCPRDDQGSEQQVYVVGKAPEEKGIPETLGTKTHCPREKSHLELPDFNELHTTEEQYPVGQNESELLFPQNHQDPEPKVHKNTHAIASEAPKNVLNLEDHCIEDLIKSEEQDSEKLQYIHSYERKLKRRVFLFKNRHRLKHSFEMHYANLIRKSGKSKKSIMIVNDLLALEGLSLLNIKRWREWWCPKYKQVWEQGNQMEGNVFKEQGIIETFGTEKHGPMQHPHLESRGYNNPERPEEQQQVEKKETKLELLQKHHDPEQKVCKDPHVIVSEGPRNLPGLEELKSKVLINSDEQESEQLQCTHSCDQMLENRHRFKGHFEMHYAELICETSKSEKPIQIVDGVLAKKRQPLLHMHKWGAWWCPRDDRGSEQQVYVVGKVCEEQGIPETLGTKEHYLREKPHPEQQDFNKQQKPQQQCPVEQIETELECPQKYQDEEQKRHKDLLFSEILGTEKHCPRESSLLDWQYSNKLQIAEWQHLVEQKETEFDFPQKHRDPELWVEQDSQFIASDSPECFLDIEEEKSEQLQCITTCSQMHKRQHIRVERKHRLKRLVDMHYAGWICKKGKTKKLIKVINDLLAKDGLPLLHINRWGAWRCLKEDQCSEQQVYRVRKSPEEQGITKTYGAKKHCPRENPNIECQDFNKPQRPEHQYTVEQNEIDLEFPHKHPNPEQKVCKDLQVTPFIEMFCMDKPCPRVPSHLGCQYSNKQHMPEEWFPREQKETELEYPQKPNDPEQRVQNVSNATALDDPKNLLSLEEPKSEHLINSKEQISGQLQYIPTCDQMLKRGSFWVENRDKFNEPFEMHYSELISKRGKTKNPIKVVNGVLANKGQPLLHIHKWGAWWCPRDDQGSEQQVYVVGKDPEEKGIPETLGTKTHCPMDKPHLELPDFNELQTPEEQYPVEQNESEMEFSQNHQDPEEKVCNDLHVEPFIEMFDTDKHYPRVPSHLEWQYSNKHQMPEQQNQLEKKETGLVFPQKHQDPKLKAQGDPHGILCSDMWGMEKHSSREHPILEWQYSNKLQMLEQQHLVHQKQTELEVPEKHQHPEQRVHKDSPIKALDDPKHLPDLEEPSSEDLIKSEEQGSEQLQHIPTCDRMLKRGSFWVETRDRFELHHAELICNTGKTKKSIEAVKCMLEKESLNLFHRHRWGACRCPRDDQDLEEEVYMVGKALEEQGIPETLGRQYHCPREKPHL